MIMYNNVNCSESAKITHEELKIVHRMFCKVDDCFHQHMHALKEDSARFCRNSDQAHVRKQCKPAPIYTSVTNTE